MWNMLWPVIVVVASNAFYNISAKSTPGDINPFASLSVTYFVAMLFSVVMFFITSAQKNLMAEIGKANWTAFVLGAAVVGLEYGFVCMYRAGWKISVAQLVTSIAVSCVLLLIGILIYKETLSLRQVIGAVVCVSGLILIAQ